MISNVAESLDLYVRYFEFNAGPYYAAKEFMRLWTGDDWSKQLGPLMRTLFLIGLPVIYAVDYRYQADAPYEHACDHSQLPTFFDNGSPVVYTEHCRDAGPGAAACVALVMARIMLCWHVFALRRRALLEFCDCRVGWMGCIGNPAPSVHSATVDPEVAGQKEVPVHQEIH